LIEPARTISAIFAVSLSVTRRPFDELALDAELLEHRADLRSAAMDDNDIDADHLHQDDVLGEVARSLGIAHGMAAIFHHERLAGITLHIRQRFGQDLGLGEQRRIGRVDVVCHHKWPFFNGRGGGRAPRRDK
jgi:hypothetical protein